MFSASHLQEVGDTTVTQRKEVRAVREGMENGFREKWKEESCGGKSSPAGVRSPGFKTGFNHVELLYLGQLP